MKRISIASGAALLFLSGTSLAQQHQACTGPLLGTWKLQSFKTEYQDTGQRVEPYGAHPAGYLSYGPDCRMYAIIARENRKSPAGPLRPTRKRSSSWAAFWPTRAPTRSKATSSAPPRRYFMERGLDWHTAGKISTVEIGRAHV